MFSIIWMYLSYLPVARFIRIWVETTVYEEIEWVDLAVELHLVYKVFR